MTIPVIFEDTNILVINKPSGIVVHPFDFSQEETLLDFLGTIGIVREFAWSAHQMQTAYERILTRREALRERLPFQRRSRSPPSAWSAWKKYCPGCMKKAWVEFLGEQPDPVTERVE